jgi:glutamate racemase
MQITKFLVEQGCKIVLMACNSASAVAFDEVNKEMGENVIILNVIDPVVTFLENHYSSGKIGVIGTKATINSGTYEARIKAVNPGMEVVSMATPLFVPMIEEGFIFDDISNAIIRTYMSKEVLKGIDALILGCTHYPIIKNQINKFFDFEIDILDSAKIVAMELKSLLTEKLLLNTDSSGGYKFFVSDFTDHFEKIARMFFEEAVNLRKSDLWK